MANLSEFLSRVIPYVEGCSNPLAEQFIRDTCIDFCNHTLIAQERLDPVNLIAGEISYDVDTPNGTAASWIIEAIYRGQRLTPFKAIDLPPDQSPGQPNGFKLNGDGTFSLDRAPAESEARAISLLVALKPTNKASSVPDILLSDYAYEISQGAIARLMKIPNKPFSNPALAVDFQNTYDIARADARIRAEASFGLVQSRVNYRSFN